MQHETVFLLIAGLGSPASGATRNEFASAMVRDGAGGHCVFRDEILADGHESFRVPSAESTTGKWRVLELFWDDIRPVHRSIVWIALAVWQLMFGLRHLVLPLTYGGPGSKAFVTATWWFFQVVRGPIAALTAFVLAIAFAPTPLLMAGDHVYSFGVLKWWAPITVATPVLTLVGWLLWCGERFHFFGFWLMVAAVGGGAVSFVGGLIRGGALEPVVFAGFAGWIGLNLLWLVIYAMGAVALIRANQQHRRGIIATLGCLTLSLGIWVLIVPSVGISALTAIPEPYRYGDLNAQLDRMLPSIGAAWLAWIVLGLAVVGTFVARKLRASDAAESTRPVELPRLVVGATITAVLVFAPFPIIAVFAARIAELFNALDSGGVLATLLRAVRGLNPLAIGSIPVVAGFLYWQRDLLRIAADTALDIVNYFDTTPGYDGWNPPPPKTERPLPARVSRRFDALIRHLHQTNPGSQLVIVAHSQGTVIAVKALLSDAIRNELRNFRKVHLVTMGSPLEHIYDYYMRAFFRQFDGALEECLSRVASWTNLYRIDDYVGTVVNVPGVEERRIEGEGHGGYFGDRSVIAAVRVVGHAM